MNYVIESSSCKSMHYIMLKGINPITGRFMEVQAHPTGFDSRDEALRTLNMMQGGNPAPSREAPYRSPR